MSLRDRLVERGKKLASSGVVLRLVSNDRVMALATGVMDARSRLDAARAPFAEALGIVLKGHALPTIDPALEGETEATGAPRRERGSAGGEPAAQNGAAVNGKAHAPAAAPAAGAAPAGGGNGASLGGEAAASPTPSAA